MRESETANRAYLSPLTEDDYWYSATVRDLRPLNRMLSRLELLPAARRPRSLVDLGCGLGGLTLHVASRLGISEPIGVESVPAILERASSRGVKAIQADLNFDPVPLTDASIDLVTSFGVFEHLQLYDNLMTEAARILKDGGWFLLSMPNLGSYVNRVALLLGFQPQEVEVSSRVSAGVLPFYRHSWTSGAPLGHGHPGEAHLHAATLRCMRELLVRFGLTVVAAQGLSPGSGSRAVKLLDAIFGHVPALSRRFIILAERMPRQQLEGL